MYKKFLHSDSERKRKGPALKPGLILIGRAKSPSSSHAIVSHLYSFKLRLICQEKSPRAGLQPATYHSRNDCSMHLSYGAFSTLPKPLNYFKSIEYQDAVSGACMESVKMAYIWTTSA